MLISIPAEYPCENGVSAERIRQIEVAAMKKLRKVIEAEPA